MSKRGFQEVELVAHERLERGAWVHAGHREARLTVVGEIDREVLVALAPHDSIRGRFFELPRRAFEIRE
jgi:hypothetical protein